jgi:prepilin-type N-terminal cleavage/methylation domain-containing protein
VITANARTRSAFSLIELVIVVVIIGIIAAIAIPRMSRGASGAADGALVADLKVLRNAMDMYLAEHGNTPPTLVNVVAALTTYSDATGATNGTKTTTYIYGPYLRAIPALPVGADKGKTSIVATYTAGNGWVYNATTGHFSANTGIGATETDDKGVLYSTY